MFRSFSGNTTVDFITSLHNGEPRNKAPCFSTFIARCGHLEMYHMYDKMIFFQGDYSHPHQSPPWYGRPLCTLCLTDCDMVFGRSISVGERGDHRGPLKLSLATG